MKHLDTRAISRTAILTKEPHGSASESASNSLTTMAFMIALVLLGFLGASVTLAGMT